MYKFITHTSYAGDNLSPHLVFSDNQLLSPIGKTISLSFDTNQRFCTGWHDLATGESHPCPNNSKIDKKYDVCPACQRRTGFNPAFYHSATVSTQQEARNAEPHHLYLAYMGEGYLKVGISWHKRGIKRLLDQGARAGLIIDTYPTALIARQYEAKIARLSGMNETTATRTKLALLNKPFSAEQASQNLLDNRKRIEDELAISTAKNNVLLLDNHYGDTTNISDVTPRNEASISGKVVAMIGDILVTLYDDRYLALPLKQYTGYPLEMSDEIINLDLEPQQMGLF